VNNSSDIDFIAVTSRRMTSKDTESLNLVHKELALTYLKSEMDGVYIIQKEIGKLSKSAQPNITKMLITINMNGSNA
jgi:DNA-binding MarR family transcriptional regulator